MNRKNILKLLLDICMIVTLVLMYNKNSINMTFHELGGLILLGVFLIHIIFNYKWVFNATKKFFSEALPVKTKIGYLLNLLLLIDFALIGVSGIFISDVLFKLQSNGNIPWKTLHYTSSGVALILIGIHVGLHRQFICNIFGRVLHIPKKAGTVLGILLTLVMASYGCYSITSTSFLQWLKMPFTSQQNVGDRSGNFPSMDGSGNGGGRDWNGDQGNAPDWNNGQGGSENQGPTDISGMPERPDGDTNTNPDNIVPDNGSANSVSSDTATTESNSSVSDNSGDSSGSATSDNNTGNAVPNENFSPDGKSGSGPDGSFQGGFKGDRGNQSISIVTILRTIAQFFSIIYVFATITALLEMLIRKVTKKNQNSEVILQEEETVSEDSSEKVEADNAPAVENEVEKDDDYNKDND